MPVAVCIVAGCALGVVTAPVHAQAGSRGAAAVAPSAEEAFEIGVEAYQYLYPLISMEITRRVSTNLAPGVKPGAGPMNAFHHMRAFPAADFKDVVRPNFDTLYSSAWLDLTVEPQIISAPDTQGRYYMLPILDMWSNVIAVPGKRAVGTHAGSWAIVPPCWSGELPDGVGRIDASTPHLWIIGRTQTNGPADYSEVHQVQEGFTITPLSMWGRRVEAPAVVIDPSFDMHTPPLVQVNTMPVDQYFALGAELMAKHPPQVTDWSTLARLERIGLVAGEPFEFTKLPSEVQEALRRGAKAGLERMQHRLPTLARVTNGWQMNTETMGVYGNAYEKRAIIAMVGLGANLPEDAVYPMCVADAAGNPLRAEHRYELHFEKDQLPPVEAFWSITMYDGDGFQVANVLDRFAIGDRDGLRFNSDGSLTIFIQHDHPGEEKASNWLPAASEGAVGITMRLYGPKPEVIDGRWNPPAVRRVD